MPGGGISGAFKDGMVLILYGIRSILIRIKGIKGRKEGRFTHPWQPARLIGWNSVWVGQCGISAMTSCQGRL